MLKNSIKKTKILKIILVIILLLSSFVLVINKAQLETIREMHEVNLSPNKEATEYFMKAINVHIYILKVHAFIDFDNILMKPLLDLQDYYLEKGKALLKNSNSEYILFWTLLNRDIYGITVDTHKNDQSLDPVDQLSPKEYRKFDDKIYEMILEYLDLKNDFKYEAKYIKGSKFNIAEHLINHFYRMSTYRYEGSNRKERVRQSFEDKEYTEKLEKIYPLFKEYANKYLKYSNRELNFFDYKYTVVRIIAEIYYTKQYRLKSREISKKDCEDIKAKDFLENLIKLTPYKKDSQRRIDIFIFTKGSASHRTLKMLDESCSNLKEETKKALELFKE